MAEEPFKRTERLSDAAHVSDTSPQGSLIQQLEPPRSPTKPAPPLGEAAQRKPRIWSAEDPYGSEMDDVKIDPQVVLEGGISDDELGENSGYWPAWMSFRPRTPFKDALLFAGRCVPEPEPNLLDVQFQINCNTSFPLDQWGVMVNISINNLSEPSNSPSFIVGLDFLAARTGSILKGLKCTPYSRHDHPISANFPYIPVLNEDNTTKLVLIEFESDSARWTAPGYLSRIREDDEIIGPALRSAMGLCRGAREGPGVVQIVAQMSGGWQRRINEKIAPAFGTAKELVSTLAVEDRDE